MDAERQLPTENGKHKKRLPTVSGVFDDGSIIELAYKPEEKRTAFVVWQSGEWRVEDSLQIGEDYLVPYSSNNNLIKNDVVLFPSEPEEYGSEEKLLHEIQEFIHRYVDVTPRFEKIASYYVLFSWIYDGFSELPYLRLRGDYGSGKTRFLLTVGSLCYKPIFASGASTVSPIFHILDAFHGTLIIDEGDFRFSDEKSEIVKILNNGNVRGVPVLRSEMSDKKEFNPRAFHVFGPKLVATRGYYEDRALESRFITEEMGERRLRTDIPINLPSVHKEEALHLRNKLLLFRFRNFGRKPVSDQLVDRTIEPRLNQIFVPLLSIIDDEELRTELRNLAHQYNNEIILERGMDIEAQVLQIIRELSGDPSKQRLCLKDIKDLFIERHGADYERKITNRWIGNIVRKKLNLKTQKSHGIFIIPVTEEPKLDRLYEKYGISSEEADQEETELGPDDFDFWGSG
jgi:hypothetical protein